VSPHKRVILLIIIMVVIGLIIESITINMLYRTAFNEQKENLQDIVISQARLIEAIARFDKIHSKNYPGGASEGTLRQIAAAHKQYGGFGETGEFTLSKKQGDNIVFILNHRHYDLNEPRPVPINSKLAEPSRLALSGKSGTIVGLDYRGEKVLAAYEPVRELNWGIVAKIDMTEVRAPFIKAAAISSLLGIFAIIVGTIIFIKLTNPIITTLNGTITELQDALANITQLSGLLPICASCKKIRDDQGYWTQIETYIGDHSEAEFSHSICPDCTEKLYPTLNMQIKK
jgi:hypothetical protein